jgi:hypothetical protein
VKIQSVRSLCRTAGLTLVGSLTLAAVSTVSQSEKAAAVNLSFSTPVAIPGSPLVSTTAAVGTGLAYTNSAIGYANVGTGANGVALDAKITATPFTTSTTGSAYTFQQHLANYTSAGNSSGDAGFRYLANDLNAGGMTYKLDLFVSDASHTFTTAAAGQDLSFLIYDVDGENANGFTQTEALRIFKGNGSSGFSSYRLGSTSDSLTVLSENANSYVFGKAAAGNVNETIVSGDIILNFKNTNSVLFQFEANTTAGGVPNGVFSAIDGDFTMLPNTTDGALINPKTGSAAFGSVVNASAATAVPEPFTIIGTLIGGTAAVRMRKKLKASSGV